MKMKIMMDEDTGSPVLAILIPFNDLLGSIRKAYGTKVGGFVGMIEEAIKGLHERTRGKR